MSSRISIKKSAINVVAQKGFTLVELMIVVAIIAILSTLAFVGFGDAGQKARRGDARSALLRVAENQEKFYLINNGYTNVIANIGGANTPDGYYTISVTTDGAGANDGTTYTLSATAVPGGPQANDPVCGGAIIMTLNSVGQKAPAACW